MNEFDLKLNEFINDLLVKWNGTTAHGRWKDGYKVNVLSTIDQDY